MLISAGIGLIACCLLIPQSDENRLMAYECQKLKMDLEHLDKQVAVNQEFIDRLGRDPALRHRPRRSAPSEPKCDGDEDDRDQQDERRRPDDHTHRHARTTATVSASRRLH